MKPTRKLLVDDTEACSMLSASTDDLEWLVNTEQLTPTFRHSLSAWGKETLKLEETKELLRHANLQTTSDIYAGLTLEAKRAAQGRLVKFVHRAGRDQRNGARKSNRTGSASR